MAEKSGFVFNDLPSIPSDDYPFEKDFRVDLVLAHLKELLGNLDKHINENEPWKIEDEEKLKAVLIYEVGEITRIAKLYEPFVPNTSNKIIAQFSNSHIKAQEGLFPKIK